MTDLVPDRWLTVEGLANARDVGGLPLDGGGRVRRGVLLRTESLEGVDAAGVALLTGELGVVQVLDLRTDHERATYGLGALADAGVPVHRLSFIPETGIALPEVDLDDAHPMLGHYLAYLDGRGASVVDGVRRIAGLGSGTTVVHCAAGKDRTGVLVALVCAAVGVPRAEIAEDYALSATRIDALFTKWTRASGDPMPPAEELDRHRPRAEVMAEFLRLLDERHGGPVEWLLAHGLTDDELARLRARLREEDAGA